MKTPLFLCVYSYESQSRKMDSYDSQNACYEIAKRTYDFVMTYVGNRTINMTIVMLFLVGSNHGYVTRRSCSFSANVVDRTQFYSSLTWTKGLVSTRTGAHVRRALQQLALDVHVKRTGKTSRYAF